MVATETSTDKGVVWAAAAIPRQYASSERIALILESFGKPAAAKYIEDKLPMSKRARSGDLGEIMGAQYASSELGYRMIARLRWKDHREMSMRGDDIVGVRVTPTGSVEFLKGESKSRARLSTAIVDEADLALQRDNGRPSPHALQFVADRLDEQGDDVHARLIDEALLLTSVTEQQVVQLLFTFTENDPRTLLRNNIQAYTGRIRRLAVGLQVPRHQSFIEAVYTKAIIDAAKR